MLSVFTLLMSAVALLYDKIYSCILVSCHPTPVSISTSSL